jgi:hypothetical protein
MRGSTIFHSASVSDVPSGESMGVFGLTSPSSGPSRPRARLATRLAALGGDGLVCPSVHRSSDTGASLFLQLGHREYHPAHLGSSEGLGCGRGLPFPGTFFAGGAAYDNQEGVGEQAEGDLLVPLQHICSEAEVVFLAQPFRAVVISSAIREPPRSVGPTGTQIPDWNGTLLS